MSSYHNGRGSGPRDRQGDNDAEAPLLFSIHSAIDGTEADPVTEDAEAPAADWDDGESGGFPPRLTLVLPDEAAAEDATVADDAATADEPTDPIAVEQFDDSEESAAVGDEGDAAADDDEMDEDLADDLDGDLHEDDAAADDAESEPLAAQSQLDDAEASDEPIVSTSEPQPGAATAEAACSAIEWAGGDLSAWRCGAAAEPAAAEPAIAVAQAAESADVADAEAAAPTAESAPDALDLAARIQTDANESELAAPAAATEPLSVAELASQTPAPAASVESHEAHAETAPRHVQLEFATVPEAAPARRFESPRQPAAAAAHSHDAAGAKPRRAIPPAWIGAGRLALDRLPIKPADALAWIQAEPPGGFRWRAMWATAAATAACGVIGIVLLRTVLA